MQAKQVDRVERVFLIGGRAGSRSRPRAEGSSCAEPIALVIVGVFVALTGCGGGTSAGQSSSSRSASADAAALEVAFRKVTPGRDSAAMVDYDAGLQGGKVRLTMIGYPDESGSDPFPAKTFVYDGRRELIHDVENVTPYQQIENAATVKSPGGSEPALAPVAQFL